MKLRCLVAVLVVTLLFAAGCPLPTLLAPQNADNASQLPQNSPPDIPPDTIADTSRAITGDFAYQTVLPVTMKLGIEFYDSGKKLLPSAAVVIATIRDQGGNLLYAGRVGADGTLRTQLQLPAAPQGVTLTLQAKGFEDRTVVIADMVRYSVVNRTMGMLSQGAGAKSLGDLTSDRDGDLIPDVYDAFPDDPHSAFAYQTPADGKLTIAFEDLYGRAGAGDADYNDFIAKYVVMEIADADNRIRQIELKADAAVKLAGYNHQFGIRLDQFKGSAHLTGTYIDQTGAIVPMDQTVSAPANILLFQSTRNAVGKSAGFVLEFDTPQVIDPENPTLNDVDRPPYNPYLYVLNTSQDIHLMGMQDLSGSFSKSFQDSEGFPWALLIPTDWRHPAETQRIEVHYPRFTLWRQSFGAQHGDWYLHYDDPYVPPVTTVVHVAGYYNAGSNDVAAYWKNDATGLQSLYMAADARALSAAVSGTDVYVAGYYTNDKGNLAAAYWKNGVPQPALYSDTTGSSSARANAIAVSGTDAYVAGWVSEGTRSACWWKNGVLQPLLYSADTSEGLGIAVSGEDVYIAGYYTNSAGNQAAALWKNGVPQPDLYSDTSGTGSARANAIVALSADVYAAGYYVPPAGAATACWWKNGVQQPDLSALAQATSVAVGGADVYVAGFLVNSAANLAAVWWKNGVQQPALYSDTGTYDARANAIVVHGTDVYVAGWVNEGTQGACYWKNGTRVDLYSGGSSLAGSIAVTD